MLALKEADDDDVDLFTGTIGDFVARKRELLRSYLEQLLGPNRKKSEILPLDSSGTYLSSISNSKTRQINTLIYKSTGHMSPVCHDQSNNNSRPPYRPPSHEIFRSNPPEHSKGNVFSLQSRSCSASDLLHGCLEHHSGELNEISKPISHSVHTSSSTLYAKEHSVSHLNGNNSGVASSFTSSSRPIASSSSNLETSYDSSSGRPMNQFSILSCQTLPISLTSNDTRKSFRSPASIRRKFAITKSASVALETPCQSSPVKHFPSHSKFISVQAPDIAKECNTCDGSTAYQEDKTAALETHLDADLTQISAQDHLTNKTVVENRLTPDALSLPWSNESAVFSCASRALSTNSPNVSTFSAALDAACGITSSSSFSKPTSTHPTPPSSSARNCIWFQKKKYNLQSIPTGLEDTMNPQIIFNASVPTDSTPNSSSRPSNQFSYLSSQSSCLPAEPPFVTEPEASQEPLLCRPVAQSVTSPGSETTTLHALRSGLSIGFGKRFEKSHAQPSCDVAIGTLDLVKGERHASSSTLTRLRSGVVADEASSLLFSDLSIPTTNNNASPLRQSNDFMHGKKEPSPSILLTNHSLRMKPPFKVRMLIHPSKSPSLDLDTCSLTRPELERVSRGVGTSPVSTLMCLQSGSIPSTPIRGINKKSTLPTRSKLTNPSKSLPIVDRFDDMEKIGTDSTMSAPPLEYPTFYSLITYCNAAGGRITPSCNSNAPYVTEVIPYQLSEPADKKRGAESRKQSTETCCEICDSIDMSSSPSISLHSFLENEACVESSVEQKRNGEGVFSVGGTLTALTHSFNAPSPSGGVNQQTRRPSYSPLFPSGAPLISIRLEPPSMNSILKESETVVQTLPSADQKEGDEVAATSAFATLTGEKKEGGKSAFSELFGSKASSNFVSSAMLVESKSADANASKMMSDNAKVDSVKSVTGQTDTRGVNTVNSIVFDSADIKAGGKEVDNTEPVSAKSDGMNTFSEDVVEGKAGETTAIVRKPVDARPFEVKPAIMEPEGVEANYGSAGPMASIIAKAVDAGGTDTESEGVMGNEAALADFEIVGPKLLGGKGFAAVPVDATTAPAIELTDMKKANAKAATRQSFISKSNAGKSVPVSLVSATSGFVDSRSAEASSRKARPSESTGVKMIGTKSVGRGAFASASVSATNFDEKKVLTEFINTEVRGESTVKSADSETAGIQTFSIRASALEATDQSRIPLESTAKKISVTKSNPLESYIVASAGPKASAPGLLAANSGSAKLTDMEVTHVEQSVDNVVSHHPNRTANYTAAAPAGLPTYLTTDTAATRARMLKVQQELEGSDPLPNSKTRLLADLQEELAIPSTDLFPTRSPDREEASIPIQVMLSAPDRDQSENNGSSLPQKANHPRKPVNTKTSISTRRRRCSSRSRKPSETVESGEILSANFPFGRFYLRKTGTKQCSSGKGTSRQNTVSTA
ncbi:hypothetical protein TSMEX_006081 [Taenia solium]|eukprot:TsM_000732500 transcript=TsM_000732500 gene=TsM_000732500